MYTEFYRLKGEPFLLTPDHRFYFESRGHGQAMAHLMYGLARGEGFIVITGDVGAGKTTIVQRLCATISGNLAAAHVVTTLLTGPELLRMVCGAFGIPDIPQEKDAVLRRLQSFFEQLGHRGHRALLVVDEAQNLSVGTLEELRMLSNFQLGNVSPCQIFLVGQPQFRTNLANPNLEQLRQRVIAAYHLGALSEDECGQYVMHRLQQVGWSNDPLFTADAIKAIFFHTGGIPRRINTLCSRLLLLGFLDNLHELTGDDVARVAADLIGELGASFVPSNEIHLVADPGADSALSERVETVERELKLLRRVTTSLGKMMLAADRGDVE
jgi:putative secretion ATPase (PEP-CTERM system associated)